MFFFQDDAFGGCVGGLVAADTRMGAYFPEGGGVAFAISVPNEADYGV